MEPDREADISAEGDTVLDSLSVVLGDCVTEREALLLTDTVMEVDGDVVRLSDCDLSAVSEAVLEIDCVSDGVSECDTEREVD